MASLIAHFQTPSSCPVYDVMMDDSYIPTGFVTYDNNGGSEPFIALVEQNGGTSFPNGSYRLLICGTTSIIDLAGNPLKNGADEAVDINVLVLSAVKNNPKTGSA